MTTIEPQQPVALLDVDGVLVKPYVLQHFAEFLAERGAIDAAQLQIFAETVQRQEMSYAAFSQLGARLYARGLAGRSTAETAAHAKAFWQSNHHLILPYARDLVATLRPHRTPIIISGASRASLIPLAQMLGIDHIFATTLTVVDGHYTGEEPVSGALQQAKRDAVAQIHLTPQAWTASVAIADHPHHDRPLLAAVGHPYLLSASTADNISNLRTYPPPVNADKLLADIRRALGEA